MEQTNEVVTGEIMVFSNEELGELRTITINGETWFVGKDVADILGYSNSRKAIADHVDEEDKTDGVTIRDAIGRDQNPVFINESGFYSLILSSKLPSARKFKRWVTTEVLPSIREKAYYVDKERLNSMCADPIADPIADPNTPLTREELAMYFTYVVNGAKDFITAVDKRFDVMEKTLGTVTTGLVAATSGINTITDHFTSFVNTAAVNSTVNKETLSTVATALTSSADWANKLEGALLKLAESNMRTAQNVKQSSHKENPLFVNTISEFETKSWLNKVWRSAEIISHRTGTDSTSALKEVYAVLRRNGVKLSTLYKEYRTSNPGKAMVNMLAESDILRGKTEDAIKELHKKYYPEKYTVENIVAEKPVYKSQQLISTPAQVKELINTVANRESVHYVVAARNVYKEIEDRANVNLKELATGYAKKMHCSKCSKAYYIGQDEKLMDVLRQIAAGDKVVALPVA